MAIGCLTLWAAKLPADCTTTVAVDEDDLNQFDIGTSTYQGNNDVAPGDDLPAPSPVSVTGDLWRSLRRRRSGRIESGFNIPARR
jgi:hypothetical protein